MTPTPQEHVETSEDILATDPAVGEQKLDGEAIVITGMAGIYPQSHSVKDLSNILYNKENPVTSEGLRWKYKHPELPDYAGMAPDLDRFDAQFFYIHYRLGQLMDPMARKILEQTYQAIYDAGLSPADFNGKKAAVFVGSSLSDSEQDCTFDSSSKSGLGLLGSNKAMFANRISYWLNTKGPSLSIDEAECSSTVALEQAYSAIKRGDCESAIVAGANLCLKPQGTLHHGRLLDTISKDGKTKSFADNADGCILSDAISVLVLQKAKNAKRVYAELVYVKNEYIEMKPKFNYSCNHHASVGFIRQFYTEVQVPPNAVEYVEGFGIAIPEADKSELEVIEAVYCKDRQDPLSVGSVTSNVGLTVAAAGMTALIKVLLGYYTGEIAANLHCDSPRQDVVALRDGRMCVPTEHQRFRRTYAAINGITFTGVNSHVLLKGHYKPKDLSRYRSSIPRLVTVSGRQESAITKIFDDLKSRPIDAEELALFHNIHTNYISGHLGRGYVILDTDENQKTVSLCEKAEYFDDARRPLWFVYSGMGSQWAGMGAQLMRIPIFAAAIERCHRVLEPKGLDIVQIITSSEKTTFDNILNCFVGIAAIQIGLTDILNAVGLKPDGIIGHSVGELGCAYADGCLSAEEMIMCAYNRGFVSLSTNFIRGSMAAVGLGYEQLYKMCPPEIDVACRNGPGSSTISGPAEAMTEFVAELTAKGVFAKEVQCSNIPYHSRYIADAGPELLRLLTATIKEPKPRSERWLSTSIPQEKWNEDLAKYCSAEYHTNNLLCPVLFEETSKLIPSNAVLVEVAPHGLLQAILKRSMSADCRHVPLTRRGHPDNALLLLEAMGELYMHGYNPEVQALYPKVEFPVSTETPMLSHLVEWSHNEKWVVTIHSGDEMRNASVCQFLKSIHDVEYSYLQGHVVREKMCYPFAAALMAAWDTLMMYTEMPRRQGSVQFHDVHLYAQPTLYDQRPLRLIVSLHSARGWFEITNENCRVASGYIIKNPENEAVPKYDDKSPVMELRSRDIYQLLRDREYNYRGEFQSIECANSSLTEAAIVWRDNWVTFIDGLLQLNMLRQPHTAVSLPTHIRSLHIDVQEHDNHLHKLNGKTVVNANVTDVHDLTRCGGVTIHNIRYRNLPSISQHVRRVDLVTLPSTISNANQSLAGAKQQSELNTAVTLQCSKVGDLETLRWVEAPPLQQSGVAVTVHYAGLSTSDVKRAVGVIPCESNAYGMDYSGTTESGERVMGVVRSGAASSVVRAQPELLWPVPAHWSLEDAATVPLAYAHAFYCLKTKGGMQPGNDVLVHGGAGALGQAAIAVALAHQCRVFTTVGDLRKKKFLRKLYPELKDEHIGNSRDGSFADVVLLATKGKGCNVVLSCVKGELKSISLKCCGFSGVLIDTVQLQEDENYELGMFFMTRQRSYVSSDFSSLFTQEKHDEMKNLRTMLSEGISHGYVRPLSRVTYAPHDAARAFRLLAASRHRGRVLLRMQDSVSDVQPKILYNPDQCQLIFCDSGTLGVQVGDGLVHGGARKLYIYSTSLTQYQHYKIESWRKLGVNVVASENNGVNMNNVINDAATLGTVEGIFVAITEVSDEKHREELSLFLNSLDLTSRSLCPELKYFAVVSTVRSVGQDTCIARARCGLTAKCLDLSSLSEAQNKASPHDLADAVERALHSAPPVLLALPARAHTPGLLQQLIALAEIQIPQNTCPDTTLRNLGMADEKIPIIGAFLNNAYNISLEENTIPLLTIKKIHQLVESTTDIVPDKVTGLATFLSNVEYDELTASANLLIVPTLTQDITVSAEEFDVSKRYLYIVPGIEGSHARFSLLCERLKMRGLALQPGYDNPHETVSEIAERYAKILINKTKIQNNFYLLGYESGVLVALELAAILEDQGLTGTVFCVGCSPNELQETLEEQLCDFETEEELQDAVIRHMCRLIVGEDVPALNEQLRDVAGAPWSEKVDACVRSLMGRMRHSVQYARGLIESALASIVRTRGYVAPVRALRSQLVLLRAATVDAKPAPLALQRHSQRPVAVHQLRTHLSYVAYDMECAAIVNRYLDSDIQKEFEMMNLCETYCLNRYG